MLDRGCLKGYRHISPLCRQQMTPVQLAKAAFVPQMAHCRNLEDQSRGSKRYIKLEKESGGQVVPADTIDGAGYAQHVAIG